jgi:hypothetical protein
MRPVGLRVPAWHQSPIEAEFALPHTLRPILPLIDRAQTACKHTTSSLAHLRNVESLPSVHLLS